MPKLKTRAEEKQELIDGLSINPDAITPDMPPSGSDVPLIYVLGEAPGADEDEQGVQFVGKAGREMRKQFPSWSENKLRWNNAVRTRPVTEAGANRTPNEEEIEFYRADLLRDIEETKPKVVLVVGAIPLSALMPGSGGIKACRGKRFPYKVGNHTTWVYPVLHPSYILRVQDFMGGDVPGIEEKRCWVRDIKQAIELSESGIEPEVVDLEEFKDVVICTDIEDSDDPLKGEVYRGIESSLDYLSTRPFVAFDFETSKFRPYEADARIISMAFSDGDVTFSFPFQPKEAYWDGHELVRIRDLLEQFFFNTPDTVKCAHNLNFEMEWLVSLFGQEAARCGKWADTESESFVLDERIGSHDLGFCTRLHLGFDVKSLSDINIKKIDSEPLSKVLTYNAYDAKATALLHYKQTEEIKREGLEGVLELQIERIPTLVLAQVKGLEVDLSRSRDFSLSLGNKITEIQDKIQTLPEVREYEAKFEEAYVPSSNPKTVKLFRDVLGVKPEGKKFSVDKEALNGWSKHEIAKLLLELREVSKLKSTYVDALLTGKIVYPDGRLHPIFNSTKTVTGRLSSKGPNAQNWPSRKNKEIRSQVVPGEGHLFVAVDFSQIEARCIAMASRDSYMMKSTRENNDIHAEWASRIFEKYPSVPRKRGYDCSDPEDFDKFRKEIKNQLVFPLFYGSQPSALAARLGLSDREAKQIFDDFWRCFPGVLRWQKEVLQGYRETGYVSTLTGRRRHAPMSSEMAYNSVIQGSASDLVVDSMNRLSLKAEAESKPWLQAALNIHDDLTFSVPESHLEEAIDEIVTEMTTFTYPWVTLPIEVEVSVGPDWGSLVKVGKF